MAEKTPRWSLREFFRYTLGASLVSHRAFGSLFRPLAALPSGVFHLYSKPCCPASSSARCANIARFFCAPASAWARATLGALPPRARPAIYATERRRILVQGKELRRWRTGGTSSRKRRSSAQKDKPSRRGDCRSCSDPGRNLRFLHLPAFTQNHAAPPARPRFARTLRVSFVRLRAHGLELR